MDWAIPFDFYFRIFGAPAIVAGYIAFLFIRDVVLKGRWRIVGHR
jgi:hypothetical protein